MAARFRSRKTVLTVPYLTPNFLRKKSCCRHGARAAGRVVFPSPGAQPSNPAAGRALFAPPPAVPRLPIRRPCSVRPAACRAQFAPPPAVPRSTAAGRSLFPSLVYLVSHRCEPFPSPSTSSAMGPLYICLLRAWTAAQHCLGAPATSHFHEWIELSSASRKLDVLVIEDKARLVTPWWWFSSHWLRQHHQMESQRQPSPVAVRPDPSRNMIQLA
jgi:hypothetical protein